MPGRKREGGRRKAGGGARDGAADLLQLIIAYAKQETLDPVMRQLKKLGWGVAGGACMALGTAFLALGFVRALQTEFGTARPSAPLVDAAFGTDCRLRVAGVWHGHRRRQRASSTRRRPGFAVRRRRPSLGGLVVGAVHGGRAVLPARGGLLRVEDRERGRPVSADKPMGSGPDGRVTPEDIRAKAEAVAGGVEGSVQSAKPLLMYAAVGGALVRCARFLLAGPAGRAPAFDHRRNPPRVGRRVGRREGRTVRG